MKLPTLLLLQIAAPTADLSPWMSLLTGMGGFGFFLAMLLTRQVRLKGEFEELKADRDEWKQFAKEQVEINETMVQSLRELTSKVDNSTHLIEEMQKLVQRRAR